MKVLVEPATFEGTIKRSRFIAHAGRVDNLQQSLNFFEQVEDDSATHNCWAFRIGQTYRFSDDGEPASTAGKPILAAVDGEDMDNTMVVVTRHYGGIKLGVGGLVRAYGGVARRCLRAAKCTMELPRSTVRIDVPFDFVGVLHQLIRESPIDKLSEDYLDGCVRFKLSVQDEALGAFTGSINDMTRGQAVIRKIIASA